MNKIIITVSGAKEGSTPVAMAIAHALMSQGIAVKMDEAETKGNGDFADRVPAVAKECEIEIRTVKD